jgi:hypothetical protein
MNLQQTILFVDDDLCRPGMSVHGSTDAGIQEDKPLLQHAHRFTESLHSRCGWCSFTGLNFSS